MSSSNDEIVMPNPPAPPTEPNLPNLPFNVTIIPLEIIFKNVNLIDRFSFSLTCRDAIEYMKMLPIRCSFTLLHAKGLDGFMIQLKNDYIRIECDYFEYNAALEAGNTQLLGTNRVLMRPVEKKIENGRSRTGMTIVSKCRFDAVKIYLELVDFFLKIVRPEYIILKDYQTHLTTELTYLLNKIQRFKVLAFVLGHESSNERLRAILEDITVEILVIKGDGENKEWSYNGVLKSKSMVVLVGCWVTSGLLKTMRCQEMWAKDTYLSIEDINEVLMLWKQGGLVNLKKLVVTKKDGPNYKKTKLSRSLGLEKWQFPMRLHEESDETFFNARYTWHFRNANGNLAFVGVQQKEFKLRIADYNPNTGVQYKYWVGRF